MGDISLEWVPVWESTVETRWCCDEWGASLSVTTTFGLEAFVNESSSNTGMGLDEPVGSSRSGHHSRNMVILGGLALVLVAGVILAGVIPTGDRAGTTTTDSSVSASPSASVSASTSATEEQSPDPTTDPSVSPSSTATDDPTEDPTTDPSPTSSATATVAVATCADGGACAVGDIGPGGGTIIYVDAVGFGCLGNASCNNLEVTDRLGESSLCSEDFSAMTELNEIGMGAQATYDMGTDGFKCSAALLAQTKALVSGGVTDWYVPTKAEMQLVYSTYKERGFPNLGNGRSTYYWTSTSPQTGRGMAWSLQSRNGSWWEYGTLSKGFVLPMRAF